MLTRMRQDAEAMREAGCTADEAYAASPWDQFGLLRWASLLLSCCKARWQIFRFRQELAFWHAASERDPRLPPLRQPDREILDPRLGASGSRVAATIWNNASDTTVIYLEPDGSVTSSTAYPIPPGTGFTDSLSASALWAIRGTGTDANVRVLLVTL